MRLSPALRRPDRARRAVLALLAGALVLAPLRAAAATTPGAPAPKPAATGAVKRPAGTRPAAKPPANLKTPLQQASDARGLEEVGAYGQAMQTLRLLRRRVAPDADLELALALDEARSGQIDSAATRLWSPLLSKALVDSMPVSRRNPYPWQHEGAWINGRFDGWYWYVARARAEVAAAQGRWSEARDAARQAMAAQPLSGKERLILAVCAGRAGDLDEAGRSARDAAWLDPTLPEARYLSGIYEWRAGRRTAAQEDFRAALALDSSYRAAALALVRSRLPGVRPDSLPTELLTGVRAVGLLTSPARPKPEEFVQMDTPATVVKQDMLPLPDSLKGQVPAVRMFLPILVDERGRAALHELPWATPDKFPEAFANLTLRSILDWRFQPATRLGKPRRVWANVQLNYTQ